MQVPQRSLLILAALCLAILGSGCLSEVSASPKEGSANISSGQRQPLSSQSYPLPVYSTHPTSIACMKRLPDGASVCVNRKCVSMFNPYTYLYIEEADRSAGIRVLNSIDLPEELTTGNLVSFIGELTTIDGERAVRVKQPGNCDLNAQAKIAPIGMTTPAIMGWSANAQNPGGERVRGVDVTGLLVRICGRVTYPGEWESYGYFFYVDDGYGKKDGTNIGVTGVRVYMYVNEQPQLQIGDFVIISGVVGSMIYDPNYYISGDEFPIPVIRMPPDQYPEYPGSQPQPQTFGQVSGYVRLVGEPPPGKSVRIYSQRSSVIVHGVTDQPTPFTIHGIPPIDPNHNPPLYGGVITASCAGAISDSKNVGAGATNVLLELTPSPLSMEIKSDKPSIGVCNFERATISAMLRDCEGKGVPGKQVKLTTTKGSFLEAPEHPTWVVLTTNSAGFVNATLVAMPDSSGVAVVTARDEPGQTCSAQVSIKFREPVISVTADPKFLTRVDESKITALVTENEQPLPNASVLFTTDCGTFLESGTNTYSTSTTSQGFAQATLSLTGQCTALVRAIHTNECNQQVVDWTVVTYKSLPWSDQTVQYSHPLVVDLDGNPDGKKEIIIVNTSGVMVVLNAFGDVLWTKGPGFSKNTPSCVVLNTERSGRPCIFIPYYYSGIFAFAYDGAPLAGWPIFTHFGFSGVAAAIGDVNLDGIPEIVAADGSCVVTCWNPTGDWKKSSPNDSFLWRNLTGNLNVPITYSTCALGNTGCHGTPPMVPNPNPETPEFLDVIVGASYYAGSVFGFQGNIWGDYIEQPVYLPGYPKLRGPGVQSSAAIGDIDGDGKNDMAIHTDDYNKELYILATSNCTWRGYPTGRIITSSYELASSPAMADLDGDGNLDAVVVGSDSGRLLAFNYLGESPPGWEGGIQIAKTTNINERFVRSSPIVADVNGDGQVEIIVGCNDGNIYAVYADGWNHRENGMRTGPIAWVRCCIPPNEETAEILTSPVADDIDNDGKFEVLAAGTKGIYIFHFSTPYDPNNHAQHPWPTFHANNQRTGCAAPMPAPVKGSIQGIVTRNGVPVPDAKVYIWHQDGSPVMIPHSNPPVPRDYVLTVGTSDPNERGKGAYCINQLEPNRVYKIKVEAPGSNPVWVENIQVTTGSVIVDVQVQ